MFNALMLVGSYGEKIGSGELVSTAQLGPSFNPHHCRFLDQDSVCQKWVLFHFLPSSVLGSATKGCELVSSVPL